MILLDAGWAVCAGNKKFQGTGTIEMWLRLHLPFLALAPDYVPSMGVLHVAQYESFLRPPSCLPYYVSGAGLDAMK